LKPKFKSALMVAVLVLLLGMADLIAVQTSYSTIFMLALFQVVGGLAVAAFVLIKTYA
jgi:hypothetical protein